MNRGLLVVIAVLSGSAASAQSASQLSLDEAIALAVRNNRTIASAELQAQKADEDLQTSRSYRMPQFKLEGQASGLLRPVDIHFPAGAFGTFPGVGPIPSSESTITTPQGLAGLIDATVSQPLTQLFRINLSVRMSEVARDVEREQVRVGRLEVVNQVKQLYFAILQTESALGAADHAITLLREVNRTVDERLIRQVVLKKDSLTVVARLAEAEHVQLRLRNTLASQKEQLNQLMGRDVSALFETIGPPPPTVEEINTTAARAQALEARPDVRQARLRVQQVEIGRKIARAESIPDVSLAVSYLSPMNIDGAPRQIARAGVQFQWEPFDWGRRGREVASKDLEIRQARNALRDAEDRATLEINAAHRKLTEARSQLRVASLGRESFNEAARVKTMQFQSQAVLLSDVLQAQSDLADANNDFQQALLAVWQARADYEHALGQDVTQ